MCLQDENAIDACNEHTELTGVQDHSTTHPAQNVAKLEIAGDATITATGTAQVDNATYIVKPAYNPQESTLDWAVSGTCDGQTSTVTTVVMCKPTPTP